MKSKAANYLTAAAIILLIFEILWFGPKCLRAIDYDGMAYTGIARHLREGEFHSAINAFRSPLLSWIIAAFSGRDFVLAGKVVNVLALLVCSALLYLFTWRLWKSRVAASVAILLFALSRGLVPSALGSVVPDLLFAALTLAYFILLLECLRGAGGRRWLVLGVVYGLAYLAKAFALPWLALSTIVAVFLSAGTTRQRLGRLASAALIPVVIAGSWATVLHSKYGVFTTGSQFKTNLLQWTLSEYKNHRDPTYVLLRDTTKEVDEFVVDDPMPPGSWPWSYHVGIRQALPRIALAEERNVPRVLKEILIVLTPGGLFAFVAAAAIITRRKRLYPVEWRMVVVVVVSATSLVLAYSMLVFDARYLYPLIPLLLAVAARFLVPEGDWDHRALRAVALALVVAGELAALGYGSSPFRTLTRDFQSGCYDAGSRLRVRGGATVVSIGSGPFPDHGVGWEAGYKAAFFGSRRLIAALDDLPLPANKDAVLADLAKAQPDAIMVWGRPDDARYRAFETAVAAYYPGAASEEISDPVLGRVGAIFFVEAGPLQRGG